MGKLIALVGLIVLIVVLVLIGPFLTIWAVNTLFPSLNIPYSIETWVAVVIIGAFFKVRVEKSSK
jgi:hypothetical protein